jgi:hypothetical protein
MSAAIAVTIAVTVSIAFPVAVSPLQDISVSGLTEPRVASARSHIGWAARSTPASVAAVVSAIPVASAVIFAELSRRIMASCRRW